MITFLWMLYLAFTLFTTVISFINLIDDSIKYKRESFEHLTVLMLIVTSLLWSIWYFYA